MKATQIISSLVLLAAAAHAHANVLVNPGFETGSAVGAPDSGGAAGWQSFGNVFSVSSPNPVTAGPRTGTGALKQFGTFPGVSGAFQLFATIPGDAWSITGFGLNASSDAMQADNFAILKISFQDAGGTELLGIESTRITISSPLDQWQSLSANGIAPAGTTQVGIFTLFIQPATNGGSAFFDDITAVPAPASVALLGIGCLTMSRRRR
jgi:hypothetical protein